MQFEKINGAQKTQIDALVRQRDYTLTQGEEVRAQFRSFRTRCFATTNDGKP